MERLRRQYERPETLQTLLRGYLAHVHATYGAEFPPRVAAIFERAIALDLPYLNVLLATIFTDTEEAIKQHLVASDAQTPSPSSSSSPSPSPSPQQERNRVFVERFLRFVQEMCTRLRSSSFDATNARETALAFVDTVADAFVMRNDALIDHVLTQRSFDDAGMATTLTAETLAAARYSAVQR